MYKPEKIANYFLSKFGQDNDITPMKLVKLVYIAHGWYLGMTGEALISENPEAWKYGPVVPSIYHTFKSYGSSPIKKTFNSEIELPEDIKKLLDKIWDVYGRYNAIELSSMTHQENTPWHRVWNDASNENYFSLQISQDLISEYYKQKLEANKKSNQKPVNSGN